MRARSSAVAGIVAAVLLLVGTLILKLPGGPDNDREVVSFFGSKGHRTNQLVGGYLWALAAVALVFFVVELSNRVLIGDRSVVARVSGAAAAAMLLAAAATAIAMAASIVFQDGGKTSQQVATIGWVAAMLFLVAFPFALLPLLLVMAASANVPTWLKAVTVLTIVAMLAGISFISMVLLPIWLVAASVHLLRGVPVRSAASPA